jgi:peptidoglycan/LPS O-acetylase OafA/YrhL
MERLHFLDALRGWAALVVVLCHTLQVWLANPTRMGTLGLGQVLDAVNSTPLGILMDGQLAVYVFFVISGAALSYSILIADNPKERLLMLALSRYLRLTLPVLGSCLLAFAILASGGFSNVEAAAASQSSWLDDFYRFEPNFLSMLRFAVFDVYFAYDSATSWNAVLWTMPIELVWSFAVFALFAAPWRLLRRCLALALTVLLFDHASACFFAGYLIADLIAAQRTHSQPRSAMVGVITIALAMALATLRSAPLTYPINDILQTVAGRNLVAIMLLLGVSQSPLAQSALSGRVSRFLGRISFSLYLVHLLIICSASSALFLSLHGKLPVSMEMLIVAIFTVTVSIVCAWMFAACFEEPTLRATKAWLMQSIRNPKRMLNAP